MILIKYFEKLVLIFKISNLTDFSFRTNEVRDVLHGVYSKLNKNVSVDDMKNYATEIKEGIIEVVKEKSVVVDYCILELKNNNNYFNVYEHKSIHGNDNSYICEKICVVVTNNKLERGVLIDVVIEVIGFKYRNVFVEDNVVNRLSSFVPDCCNNYDKQAVSSNEAFLEILNTLNDTYKVRMLYVIKLL